MCPIIITLLSISIFLRMCLCRNPVPIKRPNSGVKQQRKESPGLQHRGAGPGGRAQANAKADRPGFTKCKDDKVQTPAVSWFSEHIDK